MCLRKRWLAVMSSCVWVSPAARLRWCGIALAVVALPLLLLSSFLPLLTPRSAPPSPRGTCPFPLE